MFFLIYFFDKSLFCHHAHDEPSDKRKAQHKPINYMKHNRTHTALVTDPTEFAKKEVLHHENKSGLEIEKKESDTWSIKARLHTLQEMRLEGVRLVILPAID